MICEYPATSAYEGATYPDVPFPAPTPILSFLAGPFLPKLSVLTLIFFFHILASQCLEVLAGLLRNIMENPEEAKFRRVRRSNGKFKVTEEDTQGRKREK